MPQAVCTAVFNRAAHSTQGAAERRPASTCLLGIGTAVPEYSASQEQACAFMERALAGSGNTDKAMLGLLHRIYKQSGIERRHSVLSDYLCLSHHEYCFFPASPDLEPFPSTGARMAVYERESVRLAAAAARNAIQAANVDPREITHVVISSCTGFFAPGPDVLLVRELGLRTTVARTILGFMGCYAGISGMRVADDIVRSNARAVVLQIAVELSSLHFQKDSTPDTFVANALFADGASAALYGSEMRDSDAGSLCRIVGTHSEVCSDSTDQMSWRIGDTGFIMRLNAGVPAQLKRAVPEFCRELAATAHVPLRSITHWAVHPGGPRIVEAIQFALDLPPDAVESSSAVLRDYGNMSSATILFVLQRELRKKHDAGNGLLGALAFGPGLTVEGVLLQVV
ncbi:MAG: type III polyketide synthase [Candidatus Sumerlaeaceae bacterium]